MSGRRRQARVAATGASGCASGCASGAAGACPAGMFVVTLAAVPAAGESAPVVPTMAPTVELVLLAVGGLLTLAVVGIFAFIFFTRHGDPSDTDDDGTGSAPP